MFGRESTPPTDPVFGLDKDERSRSLSKYISNLQKRLEEAYRTANTASDHSQLRQQYYYDQKARGVGLKVGDRVLVKVVAFDGKHKIADRWEDITTQQQHPSIYSVERRWRRKSQNTP